MSRHYYFAATLPTLLFGAAPPFSSGEFLARAARFLEKGEMEILGSARLLSPGLSYHDATPDLLRRYARWEEAVRLELVRLRSARSGRSHLPALREDLAAETDSLAVARSAFQAATPLEGELIIERSRWAFIDGLSPFQLFDFAGLCAWCLKLQILERLSSLTVERGEAGYRSIYGAILATQPGR